ncbi:Halomucin [Frankliniella fusca]|uniref:Halomucin n=1 Tax=Frankliniella fusca TaxID=407009 RepID=A0AAE1HR82_9NEOP|nr:Halomucin [Frankliniella fusca]
MDPNDQKESRYQRWYIWTQRKGGVDDRDDVSDESEVESEGSNDSHSFDSENSDGTAAGSDAEMQDSQGSNEGNPIQGNDVENHHDNLHPQPENNDDNYVNLNEFEEGEGDPEVNEEVHGIGSEGSEGTDAIEDGDEEMENVDPQSDHSDENNINLNEFGEGEEHLEVIEEVNAMDEGSEDLNATDEEHEEEEIELVNEEEGINFDNASLGGSDLEDREQEINLGVGPRNLGIDAESGSERGGSSESEEEDDEPNVGNLDDELLSARVTFRQSLLTVLSLAFKHKLTGVCVADLLSVIELHCARDNVALRTLYKFKTYFSMIGKENVTCHYYCSVCEVPLASEDSVCEQCNGQHPTGYFVAFPFLSQLQSMYLRPGFKEGLQFKTNRVKKNVNNIEDIYDAAVYQEQVINGFLADPDNISFFMYFDGVAIFKNSKFSIWPLYMSINELRYKDRVKKENIVLSGLWFGNTKPNPNLFLSPLVQEMSNFENEGVDFRLPYNGSVRVRGKIIGAVADLPAKALFMRIVQFNGIHSCSNCMSSGARYYLGGNTIQVYPYTRNFELRRNEDMVDFANMAVVARQQDPDATVYGVKGPTLMYALLPNLINCMGSDVMPGTFLGIMKTKMELWFSSEHAGNPYNISASVNLVDARLKKIKPPQSCTKVPRSIKKEIGLFKAADYKLFMLVYSLPVLLGILPAVYWEHHCKLVSAISLLSQESVSHDQIDVAEELFHTYVHDFQQLYGIRYVGLNVH